jgi:hypothetical protein
MRAAGLVATAAVLAACGSLAAPTPDWVVNRNPLAACGVEELGADLQYDEGPRTCLMNAYLDGRGAELITHQITDEGDPVTGWVRVHENGVVELFIDATLDRAGSGSWERWRCDALSHEEGPRVFVPDECEQLPIP